MLFSLSPLIWFKVDENRNLEVTERDKMALFVIGFKNLFLHIQMMWYLIDSQQKHKESSSSRKSDHLQP